MDRLLHLKNSAVGFVAAYLAEAHGLPRAAAEALVPEVFDRVVESAAHSQAQPKKAYIKVWRTIQSTSKQGLARSQTHHLIAFFEPGGDEEREARAFAECVLSEHPGACWAVSERCRGACAGLPIVGAGVGDG